MLVYMRHHLDPAPLIGMGKWFGYIAKNEQGESTMNYATVFYLKEYHCTAAQLTQEIKNSISHRRQALESIMQQLEKLDLPFPSRH